MLVAEQTLFVLEQNISVPEQFFSVPERNESYKPKPSLSTNDHELFRNIQNYFVRGGEPGLQAPPLGVGVGVECGRGPCSTLTTHTTLKHDVTNTISTPPTRC